MRQSGGFVLVETELGRGSTFRAYLREHERAEALATAGTQTTRPPPVSATILLVEDDAVVRSLALGVLRRQGIACSWRAARRRRSRARAFDLLVTDVVMPHLGGPELAAKLRARRPELRVLFTSGYTGDSFGMPENAPFLPKPVTPGDLARKVREVLCEWPQLSDDAR